MHSRRDFFRTAAASIAGTFLLSHDSASAVHLLDQPPARRRITIGGSRVPVIDVHAHCAISMHDVVKGTPFERHGVAAGNMIVGPMRVQAMDRAGIDTQVLSINGYWWYAAGRDLADRIVKAQNEGLAKIVSAHPDRFLALASVSLQFPDLAAQQLDAAVGRLRLHGASIGGHANGEDLSLPEYDPFWAKVAELGVPVFMHPQGASNIVRDGALRGRGDLGNIIGNPLETTYFLSRLIFDGTLDRHPGLRIIAAHGGGYLPSYLGRTDLACKVRDDADCANARTPRDYFKQHILADSMVFTEQGLRHLVDEVGIDQVVYGTDMPFNWPDTLDVILNAPYLRHSDKAAILGGNVMKLFGRRPVR